jgi:hypothetical protein
MEFVFYWTLMGLFYAAKWLYRCLVYMPLLFTGYWLSTHILSKSDNGIWWLALTLVLAYCLYLLIFFLKGVMLCLKKMKAWVWIPVFFLCIAFTCLMPLWMVQDMLSKLIANKTIVWILSIAFAAYVYSKYQFTSDKVPGAAVPFYRAGVDLVIALFKKPKPGY